MIINVDSTGSTINLSYQYASGCQAQSLSMIKSDTADTWYSVTVLGNAITITVSDNSSSETPRSGSVTPYIESIGDICTNSTIEIFQDGSVACGCGDIIIDFFAIPVDGVSADTKIGEYGTASGQCSIDSSLLEGSIKQIENKTIISELDFRNGEIFVNSEIPENAGDSFREFDVEITYDGNTCASYRLSQEGKKVQCDCKHIEYFINKTHVNFGLNGSWGEQVLIMSADTHGCGSLQAEINDGAIFNGPLREIKSDDGHKYYWYGEITSGISQPSFINVYYIERGGSFDSGCSLSVNVKRSSEYEYYTCSELMNPSVMPPDYAFVENFYDETICLKIGTYGVRHRFDPTQTKVEFKARLIDNITDSNLQDEVTTYASIPHDATDVVLSSEIITSMSYYGLNFSGQTNIIEVSPSNSPRKFYFAIDCYVNDMHCFSKEGIFVANISESSVTKCDLIEVGLKTYNEYGYNYFGGWDCSRSDYYHQEFATTEEDSYSLQSKITPQVFYYNSNGEDTSGQNHWQALPVSGIFGDSTYLDLFRILVKRKNLALQDCINENCSQGNNLDNSITLSLIPRVKILDTGSTSSWEFEEDSNGYTGRVKLISGDTVKHYIKKSISLSYADFTFEDADEELDCTFSKSPRLEIYLRACEDEQAEDNLDYSSCEALGEHISYDYDRLEFDTGATNAWAANGLIRSITFSPWTMPHEQVKLEKTSPEPSQVITIPNLYWDSAQLNARLSTSYYARQDRTSSLKIVIIFDWDVIGNIVAEMCSKCELKDFYVQPPTSITITSYTISSTTCEISLKPSKYYDGHGSYTCDGRPSCYDIINIAYDMANLQSSYDFTTSTGQIPIGTFTGYFVDGSNTFDGSNYKLVGSFDSGSVISDIIFDYTNNTISMTFKSNYCFSKNFKGESFSIISAFKNCSGEWELCDIGAPWVSQAFTFEVTNLPICANN